MNNLVTSDVHFARMTRPKQVSCNMCTCIIISLMKNRIHLMVTQHHYFLCSLRCNAGLLDPLVDPSTHTHTWPHTLKAIKYACNILYHYSLLLEASLSLS